MSQGDDTTSELPPEDIEMSQINGELSSSIGTLFESCNASSSDDSNSNNNEENRRSQRVSLASGEVFKKKSGTTDLGKDYEHLYMAYITLELVFDKNVENFYLSSNDDNFGSFDDVVIEVKYFKQEEPVLYALQLKHKENKVLKTNHLKGNKGDFSIMKYIGDFQKLKQFGNVQMILYTNCKEALTSQQNEIEIEFNSEAIKLDLKTVDENPLLTTSTNGSCFRLENEKYNDFFQNFSLYTNQADVAKIKKLALEMCVENLHGDEDTFRKFLDFITSWSLAKGNKGKLNKAWIKKQLFLCVTHPHMKSLSFSTTKQVDEKRKMIRNAITKFDYTCISPENFEEIKTFWVDSIQNADVVSEVNVKNNEFFLFLHSIKDRDELSGDSKATNQILWLLEKCPLIIKDFSRVEKAIEVCEEKHVIILESGNWKLPKILRKLSDLRSHNVYKKILDTFSFSIENQQETKIRCLIDMNEELDGKISIDDLVKMVRGPIPIGEAKQTLPLCHMRRRLTKVVIDLQFLKTTPKKTLSVITGVQNKDLFKNQLQNVKCVSVGEAAIQEDYEVIYTNEISNEKFQEICSLHPSKLIHRFKYLDKNRLEWMRSNKNCPIKNFKQLRKFQLEDTSVDIHESELFADYESGINLICANPGMGKSTLITSLKNNHSSDIWTVVIHARNHDQHFERHQEDARKFVELLLTATLHGDCQEIFASFVKKKRVRIVWDGLDEVCENRLTVITKLIKILTGMEEYGFNQWVTSRNNLKRELENYFGTFARDITQFDEKEQETYIQNRLNANDSEIKSIAGTIKSNIQTYSNNDILGIPLQTYMLTELLIRDRNKYLTLLTGEFSILSLYEHFIEEKFVVFFTEKKNQDLNINSNATQCDNKKKERVKFYTDVAYNVYLDDSWTKLFNQVYYFPGKTKNFLKETQLTGDEIGFIKNVPDLVNVEFSHNSYGEYFAALYLFENSKNRANLKIFIANEKNNNIRFFLDLMLTKSSKPAMAIMVKNFSMFKECTRDDLKYRDEIKRDLLCLSCAWSENVPMLKLQGDKQFKFKRGTATTDIKEILDYKIIKKKFDSLNTMSLFTLHILLFYPFLIQFFNTVIDDFDADYLPTILFYAVKKDNAFFFDYIGDSHNLSSKLSQIDLVSFLAFILRCQSRNSLAKVMLEMKYHRVFLDNFTKFSEIFKSQKGGLFEYLLTLRCSDYKTLLHYACEKGSLDVIMMLIYKGSDFMAIDNNGKLPIHDACESGNFKTVELLIKEGSDLNLPDKEGRLPIHYACMSDNFDTVELLVNKGSDLNTPDEKGLLPLHHACKNDCLKIMELLVNNDSKLNIPDEKNLLPIHHACKNDRFNIVRLMVEKGSILDTPDDDGVLPIHYACRRGLVNLVEFLVTKGSNLNLPDNEGILPIFHACKNGQLETIQLLVDKGFDPNMSDNDGVFIIHYACASFWSGHSILTFLMQKNVKLDVADANGLLPIHYACRTGKLNTVELLVDSGFGVDVPDNEGALPIHYACGNSMDGHSIAKFLTQRKVALNLADQNGLLPLHHACKSGQFETVQLLVSKGVKLNFADKETVLPIHYACARNNSVGHAIVQFLIDKHAFTNVSDQNGLLPIHYACRSGSFETVKLLVNRGCKTDVADKFGNLPMVYANERQENDIAQFLNERSSMGFGRLLRSLSRSFKEN